MIFPFWGFCCALDLMLVNFLYKKPGSKYSGASFVAQQKESTWQCRRRRSDPWARKIPWRRKWQPTPVFLPGKSHRQRSLAGYSPWGHKGVEHDSMSKPPPPLYIIYYFSMLKEGRDPRELILPSCQGNT